ncbi:MAG: cell envelope integrity protein CreD [Chitinophagaceae bacterium]|nr:MAG: cell envelope integrity protein CreD [Chitinophagaceae bacterium]
MDTPTVAKAWQASKPIFKALAITAIVLLLLIPSFFVKEMVLERQATQQEAAREISARWAGRQNITGPVLTIPYQETTTTPRGESTITKYAYILPDMLNIESDVKPEKKHRGIYQVMLYSAEVRMSGRFGPINVEQLGITPAAVIWKDVTVSIGVSDPNGVGEELSIDWNRQKIPMAVAPGTKPVVKTGFLAVAPVAAGQPVEFSSILHLNGSEQLLFTPVGRETNVKMASGWPDPSFTGSLLAKHSITDTGFKASWKSLPNNRAFPQAWKETEYNLQASSFGADLFIQVNNYQKIIRSVKYAFLVILLTFAAFFVVEISSKKSIHPVQYGLVGLALILFYTLLLSISEYLGFDIAYLIASVATIGLIAWFVRGLLASARLASIIAIVMVLLYAYVFSTLQMEDYSLLLGSIGLFIALAVVMKFSKRLQW